MMGCDIHMYAEVLKDNSWEKVGNIFPNVWFTPTRPTVTDPDGYVWNRKYTDNPYQDRNYDLFALLADVRNYEEIDPIEHPRGIPNDASEDIHKLSENYGSDGHSHSWFTLAELIEYYEENKEISESASAEFFKETLPLLGKLSKNPEDIRIVFWFDN